jgi:hypothetical protein
MLRCQSFGYRELARTASGALNGLAFDDLGDVIGIVFFDERKAFKLGFFDLAAFADE